MNILKNLLLKILISLMIFNIFTLNIVTNAEGFFEENTEEETIEENDDVAVEPQIYSESAILMEIHTGKVIYAKDVYTRKYPASTTKILTAIIAIENCSLDQEMIASQNAVALPSSSYTSAFIQAGESFTLDELLSVLMIRSANEAANVIAENIGGNVEDFAEMMNDKAKQIGCLDSHFVNANGIHDENHYSTSYDMATIAAYCMKNDIFRKYANLLECQLPDTEFWGEEQKAIFGERHFYNTNKLLIEGDKYYYPYCTGIKTGFTTPAKNCLIASSDKDGFELISVILHAEQTEEKQSARYMDTINLFEYGYNNFSRDEIYEEAGYDHNKAEEEIIDIDKESAKESVIKEVEKIVEETLPEDNNTNESGFIMLVVGGSLCILFIIVIGIIVYVVIRKKINQSKR